MRLLPFILMIVSWLASVVLFWQLDAEEHFSYFSGAAGCAPLCTVCPSPCLPLSALSAYRICCFKPLIPPTALLPLSLLDSRSLSPCSAEARKQSMVMNIVGENTNRFRSAFAMHLDTVARLLGRITGRRGEQGARSTPWGCWRST